MQFDLSTFVLEIFNFLVLVWLLQHFLYRPVRNIIDRRQRAIEKSMGDAAAARQEAEQLKTQYAARMSDWETEKRRLQDKLQQDLSVEREQRMTALQNTLADERKKTEILEQRRQADIMQKNERAAMAQAGQFAAQLLLRAAGPALNGRLAEIFINDLNNLPADRRVEIEKAAAGADARVISAFPLDGGQRESITAALKGVTGTAIACTFSIDPEVICGVRIGLGAYLLEGSIAGELQFFTRNWSEAA